ncbi:MAG: hypothetical protein ACLVB5_03880 [Christensenellales bacterium]
MIYWQNKRGQPASDRRQKAIFLPEGGRIAISANERIAEFLDFAIQAKFAYVNKLKRVQPAFFDVKDACVSRESTDCRRKKLTKEKLWFIIETLIGS